jgi:phasin family protein
MTDKTSPKADAAPASIFDQQKNAFSDAMQRSMGAFGDFGGKSQQTVDAVKASGALTAKTVETLNSRAVAYSKKAADDAMAAAKALAAAKTPQQAIELQTAFATSAFNAYIAEFSAVSGLLVDSFNQNLASFKAAPKAPDKA